MKEKTTMPETNQKIVELKTQIYDIFEAQAYLTAQHQQLETRKGELAKALAETRQVEAAAAEKAKAGK